ncbi:unnamed protein product [Prorocentrum cordatum]|uniref:Uncharacterized protein n=2 Tax=Prorocentrum cordatum TaxID=2364126 RepID=A0ABN9XWK0_9DINO|nr:unnamed protein product [Polarella glacialis]CAK0903204.1 unnamed protein product [Polarella glacialis]|mmetsp:Transcript_93081/g.252504  ORF Transcript_93081/g.252504 Transcript_93081/m.252504 type:complete len:567 (+) Transcript_93081:68-1768(+)
MSTADTKYKKGDEVYVFYSMNKRCQRHRKYMAVLDPRHGSFRPRVGISEGWVPARVAADQEAPDKVRIEYRWPYFYTMRGQMADPPGFGREPWTELYPAPHVMPAGDPDERGAPFRALVPPGSQPELAVLAFRWGGMNEIIAPEQWGETGSSVSDLFLESFVDMAVVPQLGTDYEVWTVYVEDQTDLVKLADTVHLVFGQHHPARRAKRTVGMFFLYPTGFEENCVPNYETGEDHGAAMVDRKSLFRLMKACEKAGIPTRFPHPSNFYQQLTSKDWTHLMSVVPHLRVPPTVAMPRMLVERSCRDAAEKGIASLRALKRHQAELRGEPPEGEITKGVAKLSYSWEALDVKFWEGPRGLEEALHNLTQFIEISQEFTGQPHDCENIIVQEFCEHDLELRMYVVDGVIESQIFTKFCKIKENREFGDFKQTFSKSQAAKDWMGGDHAAMDDGERQCRELTDHWLAWAQAQLCEMPPAIRFDYFVGRSSAGGGKAVVWTLEICELGFSMLGESKLPAKVFQAMLQSCLECSQADSAADEDQEPAKTGAEGPASKGAPDVAVPKKSRRRR